MTGERRHPGEEDAGIFRLGDEQVDAPRRDARGNVAGDDRAGPPGRDEEAVMWPRDEDAGTSPGQDETAAWPPEGAVTGRRDPEEGAGRGLEGQSVAWPPEDRVGAGRLEEPGAGSPYEETTGWPGEDEAAGWPREEERAALPPEERTPAWPREEEAAAWRPRDQAASRRTPQETAGWPAREDEPRLEPEREEELRSFVESDELPPAEKMEAAEREAEREARGDAVPPSERELEAHAGAWYAGEPSRRERAAPGRGREMASRTVDARLARLHLRGALIALARAELETMAGQGTLDLDALADLAEARWRSGDLLGAGEAAQAHLARGGDELIALVVAVEALTAQGRTIDARRLATEAMNRSGGNLDALFAGQPRAHVWPSDGATRRRRPAPAGRAEEVARAAREDAMTVAGAGGSADRAEQGTPAGGDERPPVAPGEAIGAGHEVAPPAEAVRGGREMATPGDALAGAGARPPAAEDQLLPAAAAAGAAQNGDTAWTESRQRAEPAEAAAPDGGEEARVVGAEPPPVRGVEARHEEADVTEAVDTGGEPTAVEPVERMAGPSRDLRAIEAAVGAGRVESVAGRLALVLRTEPGLADRILEVASRAVEVSGGSGIEAANLHIVRGDAFRVLGRGRDAEIAYEQSRGALGGNTSEEPRP